MRGLLLVLLAVAAAGNQTTDHVAPSAPSAYLSHVKALAADDLEPAYASSYFQPFDVDV